MAPKKIKPKRVPEGRRNPKPKTKPTAEDSTATGRFLTPDEVCGELARRYEELQQQRRNVEAVFARHHDRLAALPDVTGLHVGLRRVDNEVVSPLEYCIRIHVRKKFPEGHPRIHNLIEKEIEGVCVNVMVGNYEMATATSPNDRFVAPIRGGVPIATPVSTKEFGTLGKVVFTKDGIGRYLTNKHVAGDSNKVLQPPSGKTPSGHDAVIGTVIGAERNADIDAAVIEPAGNRQFEFGLITPGDQIIDGLFLPGTLTQADEHRTKCFKIGAVTGSKNLLGVVKNVNATVVVAGLTMTGQIIVESETGSALIEGGDSGALLIAPTQKNGIEIFLIVGLVHAKSDTNGAIVACHFSKVQSRFGISVTDV